MKPHYGVVLLLSILCLQQAFPQTDYRKGYVLTQSNDTVYGEIAYGLGQQVHNFCRFRDKSITTLYYPSEIAGYGYKNDKSFTSQIVEKYFVEILVEGELSLYMLEGDIYIKKGENIHKLEPYFRKPDVTLSNIMWKSVLSEWVSDCKSIKADLERLEPTASELSRFVRKYNSCKEPINHEYKVKKAWPIIFYGFSAGVSYTTISNQKIVDNIYFSIPDSYSTFSPSVGLVYSISPAGVSDRLFVKAELHYVKSDFSHTQVIWDQQVKGVHKSEIELTHLQLPINYSYLVGNENFPLCLHVGLFFTYRIHVGSRLHSDFYSNNILVSTSNEVIYPYTYKFTLGPLGGISLQKDFSWFKGEALIRYQWNDFIKFPSAISLQSRYLFAYNSALTFSIILSI
jgi:hypothetical protein